MYLVLKEMPQYFSSENVPCTPVIVIPSFTIVSDINFSDIKESHLIAYCQSTLG